MRKLIVKYLALSYKVRVFGKEFAFVRAANVIVPVMLLLFLALLNNKNYPVPDLFTWVMLAITAVVWGVVLVYLRIKPVNWEELDREQKWYYGNGVKMGRLLHTLTDTQVHEYHRIEVYERFYSSRFHNIKAFLAIPVCVVVFLFIIFL